MNPLKKLTITVWLLVSVILLSTALIIRILDALSYGDFWLAFQVDSFMGYPYTHEFTVLGLVALGIFLFFLSREDNFFKTKPKEVKKT